MLICHWFIFFAGVIIHIFNPFFKKQEQNTVQVSAHRLPLPLSSEEMLMSLLLFKGRDEKKGHGSRMIYLEQTWEWWGRGN